MTFIVFSGKTVTSITLAKQYEAALLSLDGVILDAISNGNTPSGLKAREMCAEAAKKRMEMMMMMEGEDGEKKAAGGLSVEAVTAHTQGASKLLFDISCKMITYFEIKTVNDQFVIQLVNVQIICNLDCK